MSKHAVFTMKLEPELREAFVAEAEAAHRPASQVVRELMREYIRARREARDYDAFVERKVAIARDERDLGLGAPNDEVEAAFAARRAATLTRDFVEE